jgi:hypothetical protein
MPHWSTSMKAVKHGGSAKRAWKRLRLGVDRSGMILAGVLTDGRADDARTALGLIDEVDGDIASFTADTAYDTTAIYEAAGARGAGIIVTSALEPGVPARKIERPLTA